MRNISDKQWIKLMEVGRRYGCHQMPERSFFFGGRQFPLCARCTGAAVGQTAAGVAALCGARLNKKGTLISLGGCAIMLGDWLVQRAGIKESTNFRRFVTGALCGFGLGMIYSEGLIRAYKAIRKVIQSQGESL